MQLALSFPQRLDAVVLCDTAARIGTPELWNARIQAARSQGMQSIVEAMMERWFTGAFRSKQSAIVDHFRSVFVNTSSEGYAACCEAIRDADLRESLSGIRVPTLVVAGSQDPATTVEDAKYLAKNIRWCKYVELAAAH